MMEINKENEYFQSFMADNQGVRNVKLSQLINKLKTEEEKVRQDIELIQTNPSSRVKTPFFEHNLPIFYIKF